MKTIQEHYKKEIEEFRNEVTRVVHDSFMELMEQPPVLFGIKADSAANEMFVLDGLDSLPQMENNTLMFEAIKEFNKKTKPIVIAFASEGYMRDFDPLLDEDGEIIDDLLDLAQETSTIEVLFIKFETFENEASIYWEIDRDEDDKIIGITLLQDKAWRTKGETTGEMSKLLTKNYSLMTSKVEDYLDKKFNMN